MKNAERDLYIYNLYIYHLPFDEGPVFFHLHNHSINKLFIQSSNHPIIQIATKRTKFVLSVKLVLYSKPKGNPKVSPREPRGDY